MIESQVWLIRKFVLVIHRGVLDSVIIARHVVKLNESPIEFWA